MSDAGTNFVSDKLQQFSKTINIDQAVVIAVVILVIGYNKDGADHNEAVYHVLKWCQDVNLKLNKDKCHFRCRSIPFLGEVVSGVV